MKRLLRGIKRRTVDLLGLDQMSEKYHVLMINYIFLITYCTLESVFVNTLLFSLSGDLSTVILYRGTSFVAAAAAMNAAAYLGQRKNPILVIRMGAVFYFLMYVVLFVAVDNMDRFWIVTALLAGMGGGFYWSAHNYLVPHYTTPHNRDVAIGILGIIQGVMTLLVPVVSGYVIYLMPGTSGYRVMFGVGMATVLAQIWVQTRLSPVAQKKHVSQVKLALKMLAKKRLVQLMMGYEMIRGVRDGAFAFLMNMVLFELVTDESLVGINTFLSGVASITASWAYGRLVRPRTRPLVMLAGAALVTGAGALLALSMHVGMVILFSVINAFIALIFAHCCNNTTFDVVSQNETIRSCMGELMAFREVALMLGRLVGLAILMLFPHNSGGYVQAIFVLNASQFLCGGLLWLTRRTQDRKALRPAPGRAL